MNKRFKRSLPLPLLAAAATLAPAAILALPAMTTTLRAADDDAASLRDEVAALKAQVAKLEKRAVMTDADDAKAAATTPKVALGTGGFTVTAPDKSYSFKVGLLLQTDYRYYAEQGTANPNDTFFLRRVRLPLTGTWGKYLKFNLTPEFGSADGTSTSQNHTVFDAWTELRLMPEFGLRAGKFRTAAALAGPDNRHFIEAPFTNQLLPNRDLGLDATGDFTFGKTVLGYRFGIYNGAPNNDWKNSVSNADTHLTLGGRFSVSPLKKSDNPWLNGLELSVGWTYGSETGTLGAVKSGSQQSISSNAAVDGERLRVAPAVAYYAGPFSVVAEFALDRPTLDATKFHKHAYNTAWALSAGWVLTGEKSTPSGVTPASPLSIGGGKSGFGAVEIAARVNEVWVDEKLKGASSVKHAVGVGAGINWWLTKNALVRFGAEYTQFDASTKAPAAAIADDEFYLFTRFELKF
ncbi:MAG: OprO/OprP family phosphate-selective porin [Puniceicoccales bacterium]|jgi:phosphate-selective porin OprO/OprP|nr:OprO/OprP family phosphate-selective porin [Puniceicoccales bacterium]